MLNGSAEWRQGRGETPRGGIWQFARLGIFCLPHRMSVVWPQGIRKNRVDKNPGFRHAKRWLPNNASPFPDMFFPNEPATTTPISAPPTDRRRVIGTLGLAGLGLITSSISAKPDSAPRVNVQTSSRTAPPLVQAVGRIDLTELPPEWAHNQGSLLPEYTRYLSTLKLQNISVAQIIEAHAKSKGSVWNILPPKVWWVRMGYTFRVADRIAMEMGVHQVEIVSAYRCPAYNSHCEGAKYGSWHQANVVVDVKFPISASQVTKTARELRDLGLFRGGVGGYSDFTHIDSRSQNVNWQG